MAVWGRTVLSHQADVCCQILVLMSVNDAQSRENFLRQNCFVYYYRNLRITGSRDAIYNLKSSIRLDEFVLSRLQRLLLLLVHYR